MNRINSRTKLIITVVVILLATGIVIQTAQANPLNRPDAVTILVPPPESPALTTPANRFPPPAPPAIPSSEGVLPVPRATIPMGYVGESTQANRLPPPPGSTVTVVASGPRYRVVVLSNLGEPQLQTLAPGAFFSRYQGQSAMQVGSFQERHRAEDFVQVLANNGFQAAIEVLP